MPTYVYFCPACKQQHEKMESIKAKPDTKCPNCNCNDCCREIVAPSIRSSKPSWERHKDIKDFINKVKPKYIKDKETGIRKRLPKEGV